jgi:DNA (cytosine-5)-methyltransferase 3A
MKKPLNIISLFDGMSCGQIALNRLGVPIKNYYASEIDKYAQIVSKANYQNTHYLGDVRFVDVSKLDEIDVVIGGSPCQSFSFAGKRKGMSTKDSIEILTLNHYLALKAQNFEFEGQSYLFWEYMRVLTDIRAYNPNVKFLLENVMMGEKWQKILTQAIGINPICINSALVSAQNRNRLYWTNIGAEPDGLFGDLVCKIPQPKDKGVFLKDILEAKVDKKYFLSDKMLNYFNTQAANFNNGKINIRDNEDKASCITASCKSVDISDNFIKVDTNLKPCKNQDKANCFTAGGNSGGLHSDMTLIKIGDTNKLQKDNLIRKVIQLNPSKESHGQQPFQQNRIYDVNGIAPALNAQLSPPSNMIALDTNISSTNDNIIGSRIRRLTPLECERLQTVPDNYTNHVSDTQRYKMLGNGWTIDVIAHIFSYL